MTDVTELHTQWMADPSYKAAYEEMAPEFELAATLIDTRNQAGLTQEKLAERMNAPQSFVARLESGAQKHHAEDVGAFCQSHGNPTSHRV